MISKAAPSNALHTVYPNLQMASLMLSLNIKLGYMRTYLAVLQCGNGILLTFKGIVHPKMNILSLKLFQTCMSFLRVLVPKQLTSIVWIKTNTSQWLPASLVILRAALLLADSSQISVTVIWGKLTSCAQMYLELNRVSKKQESKQHRWM